MDEREQREEYEQSRADDFLLREWDRAEAAYWEWVEREALYYEG